MECQECHKHDATVHYTQVINGQKTEVHICDQCAKEKGYMSLPEDSYSLHHLLTGLFNVAADSGSKPNPTVEETPAAVVTCPQCGMTLKEFRHVGKFGCATCYQTFSNQLTPIFRKVHSGNSKHMGKIPKRQGGNLHTKKQVEALKAQLRQLVEQEMFEEAALIRDKIRDLEKGIRGE